eukprot:jgi/Galph1/1169/GphlegSOOS_G5917.1
MGNRSFECSDRFSYQLRKQWRTSFQQSVLILGIAFQSLLATEAVNIGSIIPWLRVQNFLDEIEGNGQDTGFSYCGFEFQAVGISFFETGDEYKFSLNTFISIPIASDRTVAYHGGERINFDYMMTLKFVEEYYKMQFIRNGTQWKHYILQKRFHCWFDQVVILSQVYVLVLIGYKYLSDTELSCFNRTRTENLAHLTKFDGLVILKKNNCGRQSHKLWFDMPFRLVDHWTVSPEKSLKNRRRTETF